MIILRIALMYPILSEDQLAIISTNIQQNSVTDDRLAPIQHTVT
jgi:hypothetical protein